MHDPADPFLIVSLAEHCSGALGDCREHMYPNRWFYLHGGGVMARSRLVRHSDWRDEPPDNLYFFEPALARRRRLAREAKDGKKAEVIDRTGSVKHLERAAKSLRHVKAEDRILYVPYWDMAKAEEAMRKAGVRGAVSNLCGTQRKRVNAREP